MPEVLDSCLIKTGSTVSTVGRGSFGQLVELNLEPGLECVNVQLSGFSLELVGGNEDMRATDVGIGPVNYDEKSGRLSFEAFATFASDGEFRTQVFFTVLALGKGAEGAG
jgi:hypothetical protein